MGGAGVCVVVGVCVGADSSEGYSGRIEIATPGRAAHTHIHPLLLNAPTCGVHPPQGRVMAHTEAGRHCTVQSINPSMDGAIS